MKSLVTVVCILLSFVSVSVISAADFKVYPGAKLDEKETKMQEELAKSANMKSSPKVYVTGDSFEKVKAFYEQIGNEYRMPYQKKGKGEKLPSGKILKTAFFIFDNAKDLMTTKLWAKIQRPYIGPGMVEGPDMTYIIVVAK